MKAMKKILALALAGVMALALLTGCGTGGSASHKSIAKAMADHDRGIDNNLNIPCTSSAELDACCKRGQQTPDSKLLSRRFTRTAHIPLSRLVVSSLVRSSTSTAASTIRMPESRPST